MKFNFACNKKCSNSIDEFLLPANFSDWTSKIIFKGFLLVRAYKKVSAAPS